MNAATLILQQAATSATPLLVAGFGELPAQRAGVINVGIEGTMLMGAVTAYAAAVISGSAAAAFPAAMVVGLAMGALFALATVWCRADQIVTGTALNILAAGASMTIAGMLQQTMQRQHMAVPPLYERLSFSWLGAIPGVGGWLETIFSQYALFYVAIVLAGLLYVVLTYSRLGLMVRGLGDAPDACDAAGIRVRWARTVLLLWAGAASGAAGAYLSTMRNHDFVNGMTSGQGFLVLALVIFGRWNIAGFVAGVLAFSVLDGFQSFFTSTPTGQEWVAPQYRHLFDMLPYLATLAALGVLSKSRGGPLCLGRPWPE
jgi:general nucleoside transport system permease protein